MDTMHTPDPILPEEEKKPFDRMEALHRENEWIMQTADVGEFLASEDIPDTEYYKKYVPALKMKFNELFGFEPQVTNAFILDLHDFKDYHTKLLTNPSDEDSQELAEYSRGQLRSWVIRQISHKTYKSDATEEYEAGVERQIDEATAKIDQFYGWIFQNIPLRPKRAE